MNPQDMMDEVNGAGMSDEPQDGAPQIVAGPQDEPAPNTEQGQGKNIPQILDPDQQAVMHRISEAIAMLVYDQQTNKPVIEMALQGADGVVNAVAIVVGKVVETAKPGVPRELLPTTALAALMIINDFIERLGEKPPEMREVLPILIDKLGAQLKASPMEMAQMRRIKAKFGRAEQRGMMAKGQEEPEGGAEDMGGEMPMKDDMPMKRKGGMMARMAEGEE